jgi:hypothetical protein
MVRNAVVAIQPADNCSKINELDRRDSPRPPSSSLMYRAR